MRFIAAAALAFGCSVSQAGTLTYSFTAPSFQLVDLDLTDAIAPSITITPTGLPGSSLADWNTPITFGGEFWADYTDIVAPPHLRLAGTLGAGTGIRWTSTLVVDGSFVGGPAGSYENVFVDGGVVGSAGLISAMTLLPPFSIASPNPFMPLAPYHEEMSFDFAMDNTEGSEVSLDLQMAFAFDPSTPEFRPGAAPVPEPETYALMLAGLGLMAWCRRRSAKS